MNIKDIIGQLEHIRQAPCTTEEDKVVIDEACRMLRAKPTIGTVKSVVELLAAFLGIATYLQHML